MKYTFKNQKYLTKGVNETIPFEIQLLLWNMIKNINIPNKDYLQVFKFKTIDTNQKLVQITHS